MAEKTAVTGKTRVAPTFSLEAQNRARAKRGESGEFWHGPLGPLEALLPEGVDPSRLRQMPVTYRRLYIRALRGEGGAKAAIRAFCLECVGWQREFAVTCSTRACHLWSMLRRQADGMAA
jgi:hypothetical protein